MTIKNWPEGERPREKLLLRGASNLSEAELLAIFLRTGIRGKSAVDLARETIQDFGSLRSLFEADEAEFCSRPGMGSAKYAQLQAVLELARRYFHESLSRPGALVSPHETRNYLRAKLRHYPHEVFACLYLDTKHRVITFEELFFGTIDSASVHPREVVRRVIKHNAAAVIFSHNHPSGISEPSESDRLITERLRKALELIDVRVLDHMIVGDADITSMAERGML